MPYKISVVTPQHHGRAVIRDGHSSCWGCGEEIRVGDKYVSKMGSGGRAKPKRYCVPCGKRLNLV